MADRTRLVDRLRYERDARIDHALFYWTQVFMAYNSNHMEGSTLTPEQTRQIYDTGRLLADADEQIRLDDAIETFYMNLWREGRIGCFSPVTELSDRGLTLIRPLLLATEQEVRTAVKESGFPIVKSRCPADGVTTREDTKNFVRERCRTDRAFRQKTLHALQESGIDGWRPLHPARTSKKEDTAHADARI